MRRIIIAAIAATVALTGTACSDSADTDRPTVQMLPSCEMEDGSTNTTPCVWDAQEQGNGEGQSVVIIPTPQCESDAECAEMYGAGGYGTEGEHVPYVIDADGIEHRNCFDYGPTVCEDGATFSD